MKTLHLISSRTPDTPGYPDRAYLVDGETLISAHPCSCCPNPTQPSSGRNWTLIYGWVALGKYTAECVKHHKYGKCIIVCGGGCVPTRLANPAHDNLMVASGIFVHSGASPVWRGSAGCPTLPPTEFQRMMMNFEIGEKCVVNIVDFNKDIF